MANDTDIVRCDVLIQGATVIDGTGDPGRIADIAIAGERIAAVGDLATASGEIVIDGAGKVLAPGFIDVHTHDDNALLTDPDMACKASQGVTTVVIGNCGASLAPLILDGPPPPPLGLLGMPDDFRYPTFTAYLDALDAAPAAINAAPMVGHSTLRAGAVADLGAAATSDEIAAMRTAVGEALDAGAAGLSTGLYYPTGGPAPPSEVLALVELLRGTGAVYATHMRDEADGVEESLQETFDTAKRAGVPVIVSHHKCVGAANHGRSPATLARIEAAAAEQPIGLDAYPYVAGSTVLLPEMLDRASRILITWSEAHPEMAGRDLDAIADDWDCTEEEAAERLRPAGAIYFILDEEDVRRILAYPRTMIGSDGLPHDAHPHPRLWGTFPRVLGHYARDLGLMSLETAVHKMTGLSAARFGLADRGVIRPGACADLVLFDAATVIDRATFEEPTRPADGIALVMVNGVVVRDGNGATGARPGRVLRRP
jgi:N-acyl-D-amino-acid deacylase